MRAAAPEFSLSALQHQSVGPEIQGVGSTHDTASGRAGLTLFEQICEQRQNLAMILLSAWTQLPQWLRVEVLDRGSGMNYSVLQNALVPFYSTKRNGTGLGLALTREIVEAHGGRLSLHNREGGGLCVSMQLPD